VKLQDRDRLEAGLLIILNIGHIEVIVAHDDPSGDALKQRIAPFQHLESFNSAKIPGQEQRGEEYPSVKALKGFGGRSVLEIVAPGDGATCRAVYTVRFLDAIYVLHAFQKKSKRGMATPKQETDLIRERLAAAERAYRERQN
jgi:phage-related protein